MSGHTPGPWDCTGCMFPDDDMGGVYYRVQAEGMDARAANARLIAAAPELLEALEALERYLRQTPHHNAIEAAAARKVIAKARGEQA